MAFLQKLVNKEQAHDPGAAPGSRPGSSSSHHAQAADRAPYELDSEEEAAAAGQGGESGDDEEGPSREPSGFFRAFKASHNNSHTNSKPHHSSRIAVASSSAAAQGRGSSSSSSAVGGGVGVVLQGQVDAGQQQPLLRPGTPRGQATILPVVAAAPPAPPVAAPEMAGYAGTGGERVGLLLATRGDAGGEAGRSLL